MTVSHQSIPLSKLTPWLGNVRKTQGADTALAELAASISAHGLLQPLLVREDKRGRYAVIAGSRRLAALQSLVKDGSIKADHLVPCSLLPANVNAVEASLAENILREAMHPADQFEAFRDLIDAGASVTDIAARFGVAESTVEKRLRLARVSPVILTAYRAGEIDLECVMAFAVTEDHASQENLWREAPGWMRDDARRVRAALTENDIAATDKRVRFVSLKAYDKAGGAIRRDLFAEGDKGVFILDSALLESLVLKKLGKAAKAIAKEGWKWTEVRPSFSYDDAASYKRRHAEPVPLTDEQTAELAALETEADAFYDIEGDLSPEQQARFDEISAHMDEINDVEEFWPAETLAIAGAVISVDSSGKLDVTRGLIRPEDLSREPKASPKAARDPDALPSSLTESLTAERSAALSAALMNAPELALPAVVHAFALEAFYRAEGSCLDLSLSVQSFKRAEGSKAVEALEAARKSWQARLPEDPADLWSWCMTQLSSSLLELLALCAALSLDAVVAPHRRDSERIQHADAIATALAFDMNAWFRPTAENYFVRISKPQMLTDLQEAKGVPPAPAWSSMKKTELADLAAREVAGTSWLPKPLRIAVAA
jgi:ParB family chromosome partitioning protein